MEKNAYRDIWHKRHDSPNQKQVLQSCPSSPFIPAHLCHALYAAFFLFQGWWDAWQRYSSMLPQRVQALTLLSIPNKLWNRTGGSFKFTQVMMFSANKCQQNLLHFLNVCCPNDPSFGKHNWSPATATARTRTEATGVSLTTRSLKYGPQVWSTAAQARWAQSACSSSTCPEPLYLQTDILALNISSSVLSHVHKKHKHENSTVWKLALCTTTVKIYSALWTPNILVF